MRTTWDRISADYQTRQQIGTDHVHYGPFSPTEAELHLLGNVDGLRALDFGCGGGQSAIALARQGARVTGMDFSAAQLDHARRLATAANVDVQWLIGDVGDLEALPVASWELIFSAYTFHYVADIRRLLTNCRRLLTGGGHLVFSLDHPLRACFIDPDEDELSVYPVRSYFDLRPMQWRFADSGAYLTTLHRTCQAWLDLLRETGFQIQRIVEPPPPQELIDSLWPVDGPLSPLRNIPHTIIFVAVPAQDRQTRTAPA